MSEGSTARLVTGQASSYLRASTTMLIIGLLLVGGILMLLEGQRSDRHQQFDDNDALHVVQVTGPSTSGQPTPLTGSDVAKITAIARHTAPGKTTVSALLQLPFGIPSQDGRDHFVSGLTGQAASLLGLSSMSPGTVYTSGRCSGTVILRVPVVTAEQGGASSSTSHPLHLRCRGRVDDSSAVGLLSDASPTTTFVDEATFRRISAAAFPPGSSTAGESGITILQAAFVRLDDLTEVRACAQDLRAHGYATRDVLTAFPGITGSLQRSKSVGLALLSAALLLSAAIVAASLAAYLRLAHREMGVLRVMGFQPHRVTAIYAWRLRRTALTAGAWSGTVVMALSVLTLDDDRLLLGLLNVAVAWTILAALLAVIVGVVLPRHTRLGVLRLLNLDRQFT